MKKFKTIGHWLILALYFALVATMVYIAFPVLIDWWGVTWIVDLVQILGVLLVVTTFWYRLARGKWPACYLIIFGSFTGCLGLTVLSLVMLSYPIAYRLVEGTWPISFLIVQGSAIVVGVLADLYEKYVLKKVDSSDAE